MRENVSKVLKRARVTAGPMCSDPSYGLTGAFMLRHDGKELRVIASDSGGWEHVSVTALLRTPTWEEMCWVKDLFWKSEETVLQYHPPKSCYVNSTPTASTCGDRSSSTFLRRRRG